MGDSTISPISIVPSTPTLLDALEETGKNTGQEDIQHKCTLELLRKAMEGLSESCPVLAVCSEIERCVKLYNESSTDCTLPMVDVIHLKQCQHNLVVLLGKAQENSVLKYMEDSIVCDTFPTEAKAIALATVALFKLDGRPPKSFGEYGTECMQEFKKRAGIKIALRALDTIEITQILFNANRTNHEAMQALGYMLSLLVDKPCTVHAEDAESFLNDGGQLLLKRYQSNPLESEVTSDMLLHCRPVLEACLQYGRIGKVQDDITQVFAIKC